jgi:DNA-binding response OmpR family regulator
VTPLTGLREGHLDYIDRPCSPDEAADHIDELLRFLRSKPNVNAEAKGAKLGMRLHLLKREVDDSLGASEGGL